MKGKLEDFIDQHSEELDHRTPDPAVLERIQQQMAAKKEKVQPRGIIIPFRALKWAAAACMVLAIGTAVWQANLSGDTTDATNQVAKKPVVTQQADDAANKPDQSPLIAQNAEPVIAPNFDELDKDIARRKQQVVSAMGKNNPARFEQVLFDKLSNEESPAGRIKALAGTDRLKNINNDVVDVLVKTMNTDANTNVRLAALNGLAKFYREDYVRKQLISALKKQDEPMVQIALINMLTRMKESSILTELERILKDDTALDAVKESAYAGQFELKGI